MTAKRYAIAIWILGLVLCGAVIAQTRFATDMSAFLPRSADPNQQILVDQLSNGVASRLMLLAIEGAEPGTLTALSKALAARLRTLPKLALVNNGEEAGLERDRDYLWRNRYLLSPGVTPDRFTQEGLHEALEADLRLLRTEMGLLSKRMLPGDPTQEMLLLLEQLGGGGRPSMRDGVWVSGAANRAILMVEAHAAAFDIDAQEQVLTEIQHAFEAVRAGVPDAEAARLLATGPPVFAVTSRAEIKGDASRFSFVATALVALLLLGAYRSPRVLVLALIPVATGVAAGVTAVSLGFGFVHGITLGFGVTLIGEAVDYAIYLLTQTSRANPPVATLRRIWPTLRLGLLLSVSGFGAMLLSGFPGFVQLGLFTITGLVTALAVTRFVIPVLLPQGFAGADTAPLDPILRRLLTVLPRMRLWLAGLLALALLALLLHPGGYWEDELSSMNPVPKSALALDQTLRRDLGTPDTRHMVMLRAKTEQEVLLLSERAGAALRPLIAENSLGGLDAPHLYLPSEAAQRARQAAIPPDGVLRANLDGALDGLPFRGELFAPFLTAAAAAKERPLLTRESLAGTTLALKVESMLVSHGGSMIAILPLHGVTEMSRVEEALSALPGGAVSILDMKRESDRLLSGYLREAQALALVGILAVTVLLATALRSVERVLTVLAPLAAAVVLTTALLTLGGAKLSIFNLFGLLLVVAVGSNYALFFERARHEPAEAHRMIASLVLANLCTVIGFGVLSFSSVPVLRGIGTTVATGTILSLVIGAVLTAAPRKPS